MENSIVGATEYCFCLTSRLIRVGQGCREQIPQPFDISIIPAGLIIEGRVDIEQDGDADEIIIERSAYAEGTTDPVCNRPTLGISEASIEESVDRKGIDIRLFAFWGVGVVLAWGRGLPDD